MTVTVPITVLATVSRCLHTEAAWLPQRPASSGPSAGIRVTGTRVASRRRHPCHERGIQIATARHGTEIFQSKFKLPMIREPGGWAAAAVRIVYRDGVSVPVPRAAECLRLCDVDVAAKTPFAAAATRSAVIWARVLIDTHAATVSIRKDSDISFNSTP